jgi:hypothetical protein
VGDRAEGCGAVVYLGGHEGRVIGLSHKIRAYVLPPRFNGFPRTEAADFSEEIGSGRTPLKGPLSMTTVTAATPHARDLLHDRPTRSPPAFSPAVRSPPGGGR